jgi:hypothetical protein
MGYSSYRPHYTEKDEWQDNSIDHQVRRRNALFEQLRSDQYDSRAKALSQLLANLESWTRLAYQAGQGWPAPVPLGNDGGGGGIQRQDSIAETCLFTLDNEDGVASNAAATADTLGRDEALASTSSLSLPLDLDLPEPEQPPGTLSPITGEDDQYADYSMYGTETSITSPMFDRASLREALKTYLVLVLRASIDCPFADVRRKCRYILYRIAKLSAPVPAPICDSPSWLIPVKETVAYGHDKTSERPGSFSIASQSVKSSLGRTQASLSNGFLSEDSGDESPVEGAFVLPEHKAQPKPPSVFSSSPATEVGPTSGSVDSQVFDSVDPIPITGRVVNKRQSHVPNASDIDNILLGPAGGRRARFSMDIASPSSLTRPALGRKRSSNSQSGFQTQRRASPSLRQLHISCYQASGRITNLGRILSYFPRFYETTIMLHDELIRKTGTPLQRVTKLYLCLMAAAESKSQYHVSYFTYKYLQLGEHADWLEGLHKAPRRIQKLATINAILAHQPWKMNKAHIQDLLGRSKEAVHTSDQWTMGELCQAMCILTVVHSQARFALGCGVVPEPDSFGGACIRRTDVDPKHSVDRDSETPDGLNTVPLFLTSAASYSLSDQSNSIMTLPGSMETDRRESKGSDEDSLPSLLRRRRLSLGHQRAKSDEDSSYEGQGIDRDLRGFSSREAFVRCGIEDLAEDSIISTSAPSQSVMVPWWKPNHVQNSPGVNGLLSQQPSFSDLVAGGIDVAKLPVNPILEDMSRYCRAEADISDDIFDINSDQYPILDLSEFNWEDHCCALVGRIVPGLETILEQTLTEAQDAAGELDEGFLFSDKHGPVDQRPLREAVWNFVLRLYGVHQEGFRYQDVHLLLNRSARRFLKKVCFNAEGISRHDWASVGKGLTDPEKVLLTLLASHARLSASLLYAFRFCE